MKVTITSLLLIGAHLAAARPSGYAEKPFEEALAKRQSTSLGRQIVDLGYSTYEGVQNITSGLTVWRGYVEPNTTSISIPSRRRKSFSFQYLYALVSASQHPLWAICVGKLLNRQRTTVRKSFLQTHLVLYVLKVGRVELVLEYSVLKIACI